MATSRSGRSPKKAATVATERKITTHLKLNGVPLATIQFEKFEAGVSYAILREHIPLCRIAKNKSFKVVFGGIRHIETFASGLAKAVKALCTEGLHSDAAYLLEGVARLVDEFSTWYGKLDAANVTFVAAILTNFSYLHVIRWGIQVGSRKVYMYGTIDSLRKTESKLMLHMRINTPDGVFTERLAVAANKNPDTQEPDARYFYRFVDPLACVDWEIVRWRNVKDEVTMNVSKASGEVLKDRLRLSDSNSGVFNVASPTLCTRSNTNRLSGIWQSGVIPMSGVFLPEAGTGGWLRCSNDEDPLAVEARGMCKQYEIDVRPAAIPTMVVSAIHQDSCERYYVHLSCVECESCRKASDVVLGGDVSDWVHHSTMLHQISKIKLLVLAGPSGFGKTEIAKNVAANIGKNFLRVSAGIVGLDVATLAARLAIISNLAEKLDACLIVDDADFLLSARVDDTYRYGLFQATIEFIERCRVPILCTTNLNKLDDAIVSRTNHGLWVDWDAYFGEACLDSVKHKEVHFGLLGSMLSGVAKRECMNDASSVDYTALVAIADEKSKNVLSDLAPREVIEIFTVAVRRVKSMSSDEGSKPMQELLPLQIAFWANKWFSFKRSVTIQ